MLKPCTYWDKPSINWCRSFFDPQYDKPLLIPILWLVFDIRHVLEITFLGRSPVNLADQQTCIAWKNLAKSAHLDAILDNCDDEGFPLPCLIPRGHLLIIFSVSGYADAQKIRAANIGCHWAPSRQRPFAVMT